jgi:hypothetical protein
LALLGRSLERIVHSVKAIAEQLNTSVRSVYRMLADGLEYYDLPGGIKITDEQLGEYLKGRKKCQSGRTLKGDTTLPSSEGEAAFIESARQRRRGGTRSARKPNSSSVSTLSHPERS